MEQLPATPNRPSNPIEAIGWIGLILIVAAYILVSFNLIKTNQGLYQLMNLVGALGVIISSYAKKDYQPLWLNVFWALIATLSLLNLVK